MYFQGHDSFFILFKKFDIRIKLFVFGMSSIRLPDNLMLIPMMLAQRQIIVMAKIAIRCSRTIRSIQFTNIPIHCLLRCLRCLCFGMGIKLYTIGMIKRLNRKMAMILMEATVPNSFSNLLLVRMKVAKHADATWSSK